MYVCVRTLQPRFLLFGLIVKLYKAHPLLYQCIRLQRAAKVVKALHANPSDHFFSPWRRVGQLEVEVIIPQRTPQPPQFVNNVFTGELCSAHVFVYVFIPTASMLVQVQH